MPPTEKHRTDARQVLVGRRLAFAEECGPDALIDGIAAALANAEREGMEDERTRCAEMVERFAPGGDLYEHGHDDTSMRVAIRAAILSQAGEA